MLSATGPHRDDAPSIVLLHSLGLDRALWDPVVARMRKLGDIVLVDLPGHGRSCNVTEITIEDMADEVDSFLDGLGVDGVLAIGLSLGGCVAQALALRHPKRVRGLALCDTTSWYGPDAPQTWADRAAVARETGLASLAGFQLERWFSQQFRETNTHVCDQLLDVFRANDLPSYEATCHAMGAFNASEALGAIEVPTTVIVGEDDFATPIAHAEEIAAGIPGARLRIVEGGSHLTPIEDPTSFLEEIEMLIARL
ncbi:MAG: alpha/beta fold hydrolase [Acidimicrobiia bacterium]|nr:alpha/beta fold hydrolase [Acidimicrobiia bacterium]